MLQSDWELELCQLIWILHCSTTFPGRTYPSVGLKIKKKRTLVIIVNDIDMVWMFHGMVVKQCNSPPVRTQDIDDQFESMSLSWFLILIWCECFTVVGVIEWKWVPALYRADRGNREEGRTDWFPPEPCVVWAEGREDLFATLHWN